MKWFPVPSVPRCSIAVPRPTRGCFSTIALKRASRSAHADRVASGTSCHAPRSSRPPLLVRPWGTAASIAVRSARSESGSCDAVRLVRAAIIPQPMSTPTAAGITAPCVAITLPTVAPIPLCASGITATHL